MFFPTGKYTSGSSNSPAWRKRNSQAKPFSKFKTTTQVTNRNSYSSTFLGELACLSPPRKCKSACKAASFTTCKILINAEWLKEQLIVLFVFTHVHLPE